MTRRAWTPMVLLVALAVAAALVTGPARAQDPQSSSASVAARVHTLVEELAEASPARQEVILAEIRVLGADALPPLSDLLVVLPLDAASRPVLESLVEEGVRQLARGVESEDATQREVAAAALRAVGPAAAREIWKASLVLPPECDVPAGDIVPGLSEEDLRRALAIFPPGNPVRPPGNVDSVRLLDRTLDDLAPRLVGAGGPPSSDPAAIVHHLGPWVAPLLDRMSRDAARSAVARALIDGEIPGRIADLGSPDPGMRQRAQDALYRWGSLAAGPLEEAAGAEDPTVRYFAARTLRRIRWAISEELAHRLGHLLDGYEEAPWYRRRSMVQEVRTLGREHAVPTLRVIATTDPSPGVRDAAAESLAILNDPFGMTMLLARGRQAAALDISIFMSQGLEYLKARRYDEALAEFRRVLEVDERNSIALYNMACAFSLMGRPDDAVDYLGRSVDAGFHDLDHIRQDSDLDNIRDTDGYRDIIRRLEAEQGSGGGRRKGRA